MESLRLDLAPGVSIEWLDERRVALFTIRTPTQQNIDVFALAVIQTLNEWPSEQPILVVYDLRQMLNSPYFRQQAARMGRQTPDRPGKAAFVVDYFPFARVAQIFMQRTLSPKRYLVRQIFFDLDSALAWLREG
jgi:hypothetical protein